MIRVLVADDHAVVRRGLVQILDEDPGMIVAGEGSTAQEVLQLLRQHDYDVLVLDIAFPDRSGLEIVEELKSFKPNLPVLMLSVYSEQQYAVRALKIGAAGYLTKDSAPDELVAAIRKVAQGGRYVTISLAEKLAAIVGEEDQKEPHEALSRREFQVMCQLAAGKTVSDIATELSLSVKTVSTYRARLQEKLGVKNTAEIMRYAIQRGLVT